MDAGQERVFGKYRGTVANNVDPLGQGRIQVSVPAVLGENRMSWALPCTPYAGKGVGLFTVPPVGANVWVEFEGGDLDHPIWSGCFWGSGEAPAQPPLAGVKVLQTDAVKLELKDLPGVGGFTLEVEPPAVTQPLKLLFDAQGIELSTPTGSVKLTPSEIVLDQKPAKVTLSAQGIELVNGKSKVELSPAAVKVNDGALEVL
ncbi:MAG: phage baseplate assembly protein V [Acidobacteriota bacterium]|jgi:hypothetical protein